MAIARHDAADVTPPAVWSVGRPFESLDQRSVSVVARAVAAAEGMAPLSTAVGFVGFVGFVATSVCVGVHPTVTVPVGVSGRG